MNLSSQALNLSSQTLNLPTQINGLREQISGLRVDFRPGGDKWMDGWTDRQTDRKMDGRMNKSPLVFLQDFVPFGSAALLPLTLIYNHAKQGNP